MKGQSLDRHQVHPESWAWSLVTHLLYSLLGSFYHITCKGQCWKGWPAREACWSGANGKFSEHGMSSFNPKLMFFPHLQAEWVSHVIKLLLPSLGRQQLVTDSQSSTLSCSLLISVKSKHHHVYSAKQVRRFLLLQCLCLIILSQEFPHEVSFFSNY